MCVNRESRPGGLYLKKKKTRATEKRGKGRRTKKGADQKVIPKNALFEH